jgi:hypothetical protein
LHSDVEKILPSSHPRHAITRSNLASSILELCHHSPTSRFARAMGSCCFSCGGTTCHAGRYGEVTDLVVSNRQTMRSATPRRRSLQTPAKKSSRPLYLFLYTHAVLANQGETRRDTPEYPSKSTCNGSTQRQP